jgi:hypothetical protein
MAAYLQDISDRWDFYAEQFPIAIDAANEVVRKELPDLQNRLPDYFALLHAAQSLALKFFQRTGVISGHDAQMEAEANKEALKLLISQQAEKVAFESPVRKFFEAIGSMLERRRAYLAPKLIYIDPKSRCPSFIPPQNAELIGWYDDAKPDRVYILCDESLMIAKAYWRALDQNLDTAPDALRRDMITTPGLLADRDKRQVEVSIWLGGKTRRVLAIDRAKAREIFDVIIENEPTSATEDPDLIQEEMPFP